MSVFERPSCATNVLIKEPLPARGIVSSNPKRVERLLERAQRDGLLTSVQQHTDAGWGVVIYTASYLHIPLFVASVPMGSAGAGVAFFEMYAAGALAIVRCGSNDRGTTTEMLHDVVIVDMVDNIIGMAADACLDHHSDGTTTIPASTTLVSALEACSKKSACPVKRMSCHNVEDYHAFNFPHFFYNAGGISARIASLEAKHKDGTLHCWDMETGALFLRAQQFGAHAATVLQCLIKMPGYSPYEGEHGIISLAMESTFYGIVLDSLATLQLELQQ